MTSSFQFPPLGWPLVGAEPDPLIGSRWVSHSEGWQPKPAWAVWLAHSYPGRERAFLVGNLPRVRYDEAWSPDGPRGTKVVDHVAFGAIFTLCQLARPTDRIARVSNRVVVDFVEAESARWRIWTPETVGLHGRPASARVLHFAGSWAGIVEDDPTSYLIIIGHGFEPAQTRLTRVTTREYGFEPDAPTPAGAPGPSPDEFDLRGVISAASATDVHPDWTPLLE